MSYGYKSDVKDVVCKTRSSMFRRPRRVSIDTGCDTLVEQAHKDDCDVNVILKRYGTTGMLPPDSRPGVYGDVSNCGDFQSAMNIIAKAHTAFHSLPAAERQAFDNDPAKFLEHNERKIAEVVAKSTKDYHAKVAAEREEAQLKKLEERQKKKPE